MIWPRDSHHDTNEAGREGATNTNPALEHNRPIEEADDMSRCGYNGDSTPKDNPEQSENWQSIGDLARAIAEKAVRK